MLKEHLKFLICPTCKEGLIIKNIEKGTSVSIEAGVLLCNVCKGEYKIVRSIPRFVTGENYASGFGFEWTKHAKTQYDSYSGTNISELRFFNETKWPRKLKGEIILEVGSGSGRFTEQAASTDAMVVSMDYSYAVEANYNSNGNKSNVLIVQADIYNMPFIENCFDKIFCFGVLQHTPNVERAFLNLPLFLKPQGSLVIDVYSKAKGIKSLFCLRYSIIRLLTKRIAPEKLYSLCKIYINLFWPILKFTDRVPLLKNILRRLLLISNYRGIFNLSDKILKEWALLDTFDLLSSVYNYPQTLGTVKGWFEKSKMVNIEVNFCYNGIVGRGQKPIK